MTQTTSNVTLLPVQSEQHRQPVNIRAADADARRSRLREFQSHLLERMQVARSGSSVQESKLGVLIGQNRWLLDLHEAGEIVTVDKITKVPLTYDWYLGLSNIRGTLISVIDFARFQGQSLTFLDKDCRIVAFAPSFSCHSGLLVSRVLGLRNVAQMRLRTSIEGSDSTEVSPIAKQYIDGDAQIWTELSLAQVLQDPKFLQVGL